MLLTDRVQLLVISSVCVIVRHSRSTVRPKHAASLPVQQEHPNEDDDGVVDSATGKRLMEN